MLNNLLKTVGFYLCFFGTQIGLSQTIEVSAKFYVQEDGLPTAPRYVHKDSRGLIWVSSETGLYRFDGLEFTSFGEDIDLPFLRIDEIFEDSEGWFWLYKNCRNQSYLEQISCERDLAFFHPLRKEVRTFEQRFGDSNIEPNQIKGIFQDSLNIYFTANQKLGLWSSEEGLKVIPVKGLSKTPYLFTKINAGILGAAYSEVRDTFVVSPSLDSIGKQDLYYVAIDLDGNVVQRPQRFSVPNLKILQLNRISRKFAQFDRLWINNLHISFDALGALKTDTALITVNSHPKINNKPLLSDGQLFKNEKGEDFHTLLGPISSPAAIYRSDLSTKSIIDYATIRRAWISKKKGKDTEFSFQQLKVGNSNSGNFFDKQTDITWSAGARLIAYNYRKKRFYHGANYAIKRGGNRTRNAMMLDDENALLVLGHYSRVYNKTEDTYKQIFDALKEELMPTYYCGAKEDSVIWAIPDSRQLLFRINKTDFSYTRHKVLFGRSSLLLKDDNRLWFGRNKGIQIYHIEQDSFIQFNHYTGFEQLKSSVVHYILKAKNGRYWICADSGLYLYTKEKGIIAKYGKAEEGDFHLPANDFYHIYPASSGGFWLATMNGLIQFNTDASQHTVQHFKHYGTKDGLFTKEFLAAYEDDFGFVWLTTRAGLIQFQISTQLSKNYYTEDGLSNNQFGKYTHAVGGDGTLYLGTDAGFNIFHPKDFAEEEFNPVVPLIITDFEQHKDDSDRIEYCLEEVVQNNEIILQPGDKFFNIRVALSDYRNAEKHRFAYKIEGYQTDWQEDKSNLIRISGLPYGNFTLKIKGRLPDGQFSGSVLELPIRVLRPFYLKAEFIVIAFLAFTAGLFWFFRWRTRRYQIRQKELEIEIGKATQTIQKQNEELKNLDKLKSRFFANISHELRTPLTLILGPIAAALKENKLTNKTYTNLLIAKRNGERLHKMIDEILDLTKLEANKLELKPSPVEWYPFLQILLHQFESLAGVRQIQLKFEYDLRENLTIEIDKRKTEIILFNLLSNAFKFTKEKGEITVKTQQSGKFLQIIVSDTGAGIHPEDLPHIFNRFYQTQQQDAEAQGGTGIGLALTREFVHLMGGTISVESELQKGSVFTVKIPKTEVISANRQQSNGIKSITPETIKPETPAVVPPTANDKPVILLVEDNLDLSNFIKSLLAEDYHVITAENGQAALERLTRYYIKDRQPTTDNRQPSLIISDVMMPVMDGFKLLKHLKTSGDFRHIPVIMLTARTELRDKLKALRIGVDDYLTKPFSEEELFARIQNLLKNAENRMATPPETDAESPKPPMPTIDTEWLEKLESVTLSQIDNVNLVIDHIAREMELSERQFYRRVKENTGQTPNQYIKTLRLTAARKLLEDRTHDSVKSVALSVGFKDIKYFSLQFKKAFGRLPSEYL